MKLRIKDVLVFVTYMLKFATAYILLLMIKVKKRDEVIVVDMTANSVGSFGDDALILGTAEILKRESNTICLLQYQGNRGRKLNGINQFINVHYSAFPINVLKAFKKSRKVIIPLADQADGRYGVRIVVWNYFLGYYAKKMGNEVVYCSFSYNSNPRNISIYCMKKMAKFSTIHARDKESKERLKKFAGIDVKYYPDVAFCMKKQKSEKTEEVVKQYPKDASVIGLNFNSLPIENENEDNYINTWAGIVQYLVEQGYYLVFFAHDIRTHCDDRIINKKIIDKSSIDKKSYCIVEGIPSSPEMKEIISSLDFLISGRMHAAIAALSTGVPIFLLDYNDKGSGLLKYFFDEYQGVVRGEQFYDADLLKERIQILLNSNMKNKEIIAKKMAECIELAKKQVRCDE